MAFRVHLLDTTSRISEGLPRTVNCGVELKKPVIAMFWDVEELGTCEFPLLICKRCVRLSDHLEPGARYVYGLCEAEAAVEMRQEGVA